jgi:hypothetical protein
LAVITPGQVVTLFIGVGFVVGILAIARGKSLGDIPLGLMAVAVLYLLVIGISASIHHADPLMLRDRAAYALAMIACGFVFASLRRFDHVVAALQVVVIIACLLNVIDYFAPYVLPVKMTEIPGRAGGLYINPNIAAAHIAFAVPIISAKASRRVALGFYCATFLGVSLTLSRSGMIMWIAAVIMTELFVRSRRHTGVRLLALSGAIAFVAVILSLAGNAIASGIIDLLGPSLPASFRDRIYLDVHDFAAEERRYSAALAWQLFTQNVWTGAGLGFGGQWLFGQYAHNMVLQTLAEFGVLGGVWLLAFLTALWSVRGPFATCLTILWLLASMFSHNLFDDAGLAVIIAAYWCAAARSRALYSSRSSAIGQYRRTRPHGPSLERPVAGHRSF